MNKRITLSEAVEEVGKDPREFKKNRFGYGKLDAVTPVTDITYANAVEQHSEVEDYINKIIAEKNKEASEVVVENPGTGKQIKTPYTEKLHLDESLFENATREDKVLAIKLKKSK